MVAIKDFEMPGVCADCELYDGEGCYITNIENEDGFSYKLDNCPLVEIKENEDEN